MTGDLGNKISVCVLTYNHGHLIESTLESLLRQTLLDFELVVSDDCSTDGTWDRLLEMSGRDPRIRPIRTPRNLGMAGNANFAVAQSDRPYIALLHHDDLYRADLLEKWAGVLEAHPRAGFVFNAYGLHGTDFVYREPLGECNDGDTLLQQFLLPRWGCAVRGTAMIRRDAWQTLGGMREEFGLLADIDLWMRLSRSWQVGYVDEPLITVRQERPADYPASYAGAWSWPRQRYLYEIHARNRLEYFGMRTARARFEWWRFRTRLSAETAKWLVYAVVRRKPEIIGSSADSVTDYDMWPLRLLRSCLFRWERMTNGGRR